MLSAFSHLPLTTIAYSLLLMLAGFHIVRASALTRIAFVVMAAIVSVLVALGM